MAVFKIERCRCGYNRKVTRPPKEARLCPRCGEGMRVSQNWYTRHKVNGKEYVKAITPNKRTAEDALSKDKVDLREGRFFDKAPATSWNTALKAFRSHIETSCTEKTRAMYENSLRVLTPHFESYTLNKITPHMVSEFMKARSETIRKRAGKKEGTPLTNSTINRDIATLKRLFSLAEDWKMLENNPLRKLKKLKENDSRTRYLAEDEVSALINACGPAWLKMAVIIAVDTGMRKEAIFTLRRQQINETVNCIEAYSKGKKHRVPMTNRLRTTLKSYLKEQKVVSAEGYIFPGKDPRKPIRIDSDTSFKTACRKAGITDFRFHDLRHTFASTFYGRTKDWKALQEILGHSDISITMKIYTHLMKGHIEEAMRKFEGRAINGI